MRGSGDELRWRFEVQQRNKPAWVPYERELWRWAGEPQWLDCLGMQDMPECWEDPVEIAARELDESLMVLAGYARRVGVTAVRIVMWFGPDFDKDPDLIIPATHEQMAFGKLRERVSEVEDALRVVEEARWRLRSQVVEAATTDGLGRNTIARITEGALARRLVLQFLAGYDLVSSVRRALPHDWSRHCPLPDEGWDEPDFDREHLGPYWCGQVRLALDAAGKVELRLVDSEEEPYEWDDYRDVTQEDVDEYHRRVQSRARANAEVVLPRLHRAGLRLMTSDGLEAGVDELTDSYRFGRLTVVKQEKAAEPLALNAGTATTA